jgi:hypothetical protein
MTRASQYTEAVEVEVPARMTVAVAVAVAACHDVRAGTINKEKLRHCH